MPPMSALPETMSTWSAMVAITGSGVSGSNSAEFACSRPARCRAALDHHALQAEAQTQRRDAPFTRVPDRADLALDAADAEPARDDDPVHAGQRRRRARRRLARVRGHPA